MVSASCSFGDVGRVGEQSERRLRCRSVGMMETMVSLAVRRRASSARTGVQGLQRGCTVCMTAGMLIALAIASQGDKRKRMIWEMIAMFCNQMCFCDVQGGDYSTASIKYPSPAYE